MVIDLDATLVTAHSDKEGARPTWKKGYGFHPLGAWCRNTRECLAMLLRPGNAGSNTFTDHEEVLAAALKQAVEKAEFGVDDPDEKLLEEIPGLAGNPTIQRLGPSAGI